jgi:molybdenum cofactor synthesis domain-containing protein
MTTLPEAGGAKTPLVITAAILIIGDEILSGRTKDKNIGTIADHLTTIGITLREVRVVPDEEAEIIGALNALRARHDYVFTSGGIGPTHDDITSDAVAKAFGVAIDIDPRALSMMRQRYSEADLTPARLRMARIPEGAALIENPISRAPGFMIGNVVVMAGVPSIMEAMLVNVTPSLRTGAKFHSLSIHVAAPEGQIAPPLGETQAAFADVKMGSYPYFGETRPGVYLVLRGTDDARLAEAAAALEARLDAAGLPHERKG